MNDVFQYLLNQSIVSFHVVSVHLLRDELYFGITNWFDSILRPGMTIAVYWGVKQEIKQTHISSNRQTHSTFLFLTTKHKFKE